jgi:hypothetical protein
MQLPSLVSRKLTMLGMVVVLPGGLLLLAVVALTVVLMRSERGQRLLASLERRIPPRLCARVRRVKALIAGEKLFLSAPPRVPSA